MSVSEFFLPQSEFLLLFRGIVSFYVLSPNAVFDYIQYSCVVGHVGHVVCLTELMNFLHKSL